MKGVVLDAGALIGWDRRDRQVTKRLVEFLDSELPIVVPAGALAQAWRDGRTQSLLSRLLALDEVGIVPLDDFAAREAGQLCGIRGTSDVIDASVVLCARRRSFPVMTSDPDDLRRLDPKLTLIEI